MQAITSAISEAMTARKMTLNALSVASGIPRMTLTRRMERPETFTISELEAVAKALDLSTVVHVGSEHERAAS